MNVSKTPSLWTAIECLAYYRRSDALFHRDLLSGDHDRQTRAVAIFCKEYGIQRNFSGSDKKKYDAVIDELNEVENTNYSSIAERVVGFENKIWSRYKPAGEKPPGDKSSAWRHKLSAASKLLWLKDHDSSIIIDGLAANELGVKDNSNPEQYSHYVDVWMHWYEKAKPQIVSICKELPKPEELPGVTSQEWFYRRIWDWHLILPDYRDAA